MTREPRIYRLEATELRLGDGPLAFERANRAAIDAHWARLQAKLPATWNGPFFLFDEVRFEGTTLSATARRTDYATFLYWRDHGRPAEVSHITGTSMPVLADGTLLAVRMAAHTVNGGQIYFPAGSLEENDFRDGRFDVTASIARELAEETGLAFDAARADEAHVAALDNGAWHIARRNRLAEDFDACLAALDRHREATGEDEIEAAVAVRPGSAELGVLKPYARALAEWHFANPAFSCSG